MKTLKHKEVKKLKPHVQLAELKLDPKEIPYTPLFTLSYYIPSKRTLLPN